MSVIRERLEEEYLAKSEEYEAMESGTPEAARILDEIRTLHQMIVEEEKLEREQQEAAQNERLNRSHINQGRFGNVLNVLSLGSSFLFFFTGYHFEKTGTVTSTFFKQAINRISRLGR